MFTPALEVITGPMCAGKSDELIRRLTLYQIAHLGVIVIKPQRDTRTEQEIRSRNGKTMEAVSVASSADIVKAIGSTHQVVGLDEIQFFDSGLVGVVRRLIRFNKRVIASGLNLDFKEDLFETTMALMALASDVTVLKAVCDVCRSLEAVRSQRLVGDGERIVVGTQQYSPRCLRCYQPSE